MSSDGWDERDGLAALGVGLQAGRRFIGIEIDAGHFAVARERIEDAIKEQEVAV